MQRQIMQAEKYIDRARDEIKINYLRQLNNI